MTIRRARLDAPRWSIAGPRQGARRRGGVAAPVNPVLASNATAWFSAHDGSGLQVVNSRIGAATITLGAGSGVDTNDPVWGSGPDAWAYDAVDDFISSTATAPAITATTGKHTAIVLFSFPININGHYWSSGTAVNQRLMMFLGASTNILAQARGTSAAVSTTAQTYPSTASGTKTVVGLVVDNGTLKSYLYQGGTGSLSASASITGIGTITTTNPRYGNAAYSTTAPIGGQVHEIVEWTNLALDQATLDSVAAYLIANV